MNQLLLFLSIIILLLISCRVSKRFIDVSDNGIIEKERIGKYTLSLTKEELDTIKGAKVETLHRYHIYTLDDIKIWYDTVKTRTDQICAYNNFKGKFRQEIGIDDYISDLTKVGEYYYLEDEEIYQFTSIKGICFNVNDKHLSIDRNLQKIDFICVFR